MRYPTNKSQPRRLSKLIHEYPQGTQFRTANGIVVQYNGEKFDDSASLRIISSHDNIGLSHGQRGGGRWFEDGAKEFAYDRPEGSNLVEVL